MKNKVLRWLVILLIILVVTTLAYRIIALPNKDNNRNELKFEEHIANTKVSKRYATKNDILDKDKYPENIIYEDLLTLDYQFYDDSESIYGKVYIDNEGYLHITDENKNLNQVVNNSVKFKTLYVKDYNYQNGIFIYLISKNNDAYIMELHTTNLKNAKLQKVYTAHKVTNFVDIDFDIDIFPSTNTMFILEDDGNFYDILSALRYDSSIKGIFNKVYVFSDNSMSNLYGAMYENGTENYKIKYLFETFDNNSLTTPYSIIAITENNELFYIKGNELWSYYLCNKKVKNILIDAKAPFFKSNLKIEFEDGTKYALDASCSAYFCPNEFE